MKISDQITHARRLIIEAAALANQVRGGAA